MRAASHVDWAISIGIFLLYVLSIFIFIQPGVEPVQRNDLLVDFLETSLKKDAYHTIKETPLFINLTNADTGDYKLFIKFDRNNEFPFPGNEVDFAIINTTNDFLKFSLSQSGEEDVKRFKFDSYVEKNKLNVFYLLYSNELKYDNDNPQQEIEIKDGENFTYSFGVTADLYGISVRNLTNLNQDFESLKVSWNLPLNKDFSILLANTSKLQYAKEEVIFFYNYSDPFEQADVFVKEWRDFILNKNGQLDPVIMNIRIW